MRGRGLKHLSVYNRHLLLLSPPMRGRGLKHYHERTNSSKYRSPPMRGRGLKHLAISMLVEAGESPPMRGRGLKQAIVAQGNPRHLVAPHAGAWIETQFPTLIALPINVAPHAGAWIETYQHGQRIFLSQSPPMRGRGLKQIC